MLFTKLIHMHSAILTSLDFAGRGGRPELCQKANYLGMALSRSQIQRCCSIDSYATIGT
jgi:hypothetical protein